MRVMALDVGDRRIGVALSDPGQMLATPLATIRRTTMPADLEEVLRLAAKNEVREIIVGEPLLPSGRAGSQARRTREFTSSLAGRTEIPVKTLDERYSSAQAERLLRAAGAKPSKDRGRVDAVAAALLLQSYLDSSRANVP